MRITSVKEQGHSYNQTADKHKRKHRSSQSIKLLQRWRKKDIGNFFIRFSWKSWILSIALIILIATFVLYEVSRQPSVATTLSPDTVAFTFAGSPITIKEINDIKLNHASSLLKQKIYSSASITTQNFDDYALYVLFDRIELAKQAHLYKKANIDALINQVAPLQIMDTRASHEFYVSHPSLFARSAPQIHVREIMISDPKLGLRLLDQLHKGASFAQLASQFSVDPKQYRDQGGDMGWIMQGQFPATWDTVAFSLKSGQMSGVFPVGSLYCILQDIEGPSYQIIPYKSVSPPVPVFAARYSQQEQFLKWLSARILNEPVKVNLQSYSLSVTTAINDLKAFPDQGLSNIS